MKNTLLFLMIAVFVSCNTQSNKGLEHNEVLQNHFSKKSLKELTKLLNKFDDKVEVKKSNDFFVNLSKVKQVNDILNISSEYFSDFSTIPQLSQDTFQEIWKNENQLSSNKEESIQIYSLNLNGAYFKFLSEYAENSDTIFKDYFNSLKISGDLSPSMVSLIQNEWEKIDLENECNKLIIAIHYITLANSTVVYRN